MKDTNIMQEIDLDEPSIVDTPPSERYPLYTRANVAEIWWGPATPLTFTAQSGLIFDIAWRKALSRFGAFDLDEFDPNQQTLLSIFYGYPYLNVSVQRVFGVRMPGGSAELIDASFFGGQEGVPPYHPDPRDVSPEHTARVVQHLEKILGTVDLPRLTELEREVAEIRAARPDLRSLSNIQLWEYSEPLITTRFGQAIEEHMYVTTAGSIPIGIVHEAAAKLGDPGMAVRVLGGYGDVPSAQPTYYMWDLSRMVAQSATLSAHFDAGVDGLLDRLRSGDGDAKAFLSRFADFLVEFGARGPNEMDVGAPTWETRPEIALVAIERLRLQPDSSSPREGLKRLILDRQEIETEMLAQVSSDAEFHAQLEAALAAARVWLPARERTKFCTTRMQHEARMALRELGRRMVNSQVFDAVEDFVFLKRDDFPSFLEDPGSWADEIRRRRLYYDKLSQLDPPFIVDGLPTPPSTWPRREETQVLPVAAGEVISGIGACAGQATGTARVIHSPEEVEDLSPGDVLVAASTDPSWTPLFPSAVAVVVDVGAPLSHAAIVSRELGIPCVVSAAGASRRIPNGARVTVDGTNGTVHIVALPAT